MEKEEKRSSSGNSFAYLAIVAIVAIVALVVLLSGTGQKQAMPPQGDFKVVNLPVDEEGNIAGMGSAGKVTQIQPFVIIAYDE